MPAKETLFSAKEDMWQILARETRPLVIYGMGNGADKLISRLCAIGKEPAAVFASDAFVRGQSFHGFRVCRFDEIKERFRDFVILVSFGSRLPEVMDTLYAMAEEYTLYLPDMPVAGEIDFTAALYETHKDELVEICHMLADDLSKQIFSSVLAYKLSGDIRYLRSACSSEEEDFACLPVENIQVAIDGGAYTGDTARQMMEHFPALKTIYAVEPDGKTYKKLGKFAAEQENSIVIPIRAALWETGGEAIFSESGNRNSSLVSASYEHKTVDVPLIAVDELAKDKKIDYIKYDVEGAERQALLGSANTIRRDRPVLAVSLYHRSEDLFDLPKLIREIRGDYRFYLRRVACLPAWEITLYAV